LLLLSINIQSVLTLQINETTLVPPSNGRTDSQKTESPLYIQQIIFIGNKALDNKPLTTILNIHPKQIFDLNSIENNLYNVLNEYKKLGYIFAKANWEYTSVDKDKVILKIRIDEGEQVMLGRIELIGNTIFPKDQLLSKFDIRKNRYFDESIFNNDVERVLKFYSDNGYPMASVSPVDFDIENSKLNLKIQIDAGPIVKIGKIQIDGLKKTKEKVILRELPVRSGIKFDQRNIDETERLLNNMGYFQTVSPISFSPAENDSVNLNVSVTEGATGRFNGLLGYNPSENSESKLAGILEATEMNLLGTGRQISIIGRFGLTDNYELTYQEPWVFGSPVDFGIHFQAINRPATQQKFNEREASLNGTVRMIEFIEGSLGLTYKKIRSSLVPPNPPDSAELRNGRTEVLENANPDSAIESQFSFRRVTEEQTLLNGHKYSILLTIKRDSRDYFSNPTKGRLDRIGFEVSRGDFRTLKVWIDLNQYLKVYSQQVLALGIHAGRILGDDIPLTELLYLGGANTLRGYNEDMFRGEGRFYTNLEYRFIVGRNSQFFLFLDSGSVYNKSGNNGLGPLKIGYGLGMRLESMNGLISMDYGLAKGDSILKGKIHVSLGAVF
jgi:outer membrane protein insertion porin family